MTCPRSTCLAGVEPGWTQPARVQNLCSQLRTRPGGRPSHTGSDVPSDPGQVACLRSLSSPSAEWAAHDTCLWILYNPEGELWSDSVAM